jgi:NAD+ synthase (glutamine-hydrolysing)
MLVSPEGDLAAFATTFEEDLLVVDVPSNAGAAASIVGDPRLAWPDKTDEIYRALVLGLRDYAVKNDFREVLIGLSGGIDSALTAVIAVDALGPEAVRTLSMPSPYSSPESTDDAVEIARRLGIRIDVVPIERPFSAYLNALAPVFGGTETGVAEENLQARIRGNLLMALSNKFGGLVLATGNKSEYAVGYSTLYGDMAGGFAPIKDVPKTLVYELSRWRNEGAEPPPIPDRVLDKPPSAELRPGQKDTDSLPPYDQLDPIVEAYVEDDRSPEEIAAAGFNPQLVDRVIELIDRAEYKRRQAAPGIKITPKAFGRDRRMPITNRYRRR